MTVAQLQTLLSDFDPEAPVFFGYPATDNYGMEYQVRTEHVFLNELNVNSTGTFAPILFLDGSQELKD